MRRKRRVNVTGASISLMDLLSCAFGAVLVLSALFSALIKASLAAGQEAVIMADCSIAAKDSLQPGTKLWLKSMRIGFQVEFPNGDAMLVWNDMENQPVKRLFPAGKNLDIDIMANKDDKLTGQLKEITVFYAHSSQSTGQGREQSPFSTLLLKKLYKGAFGQYRLSIFLSYFGDFDKRDKDKQVTFSWFIRFPTASPDKQGVIDEEKSPTFQELKDDIDSRLQSVKNRRDYGPIVRREKFFVSF